MAELVISWLLFSCLFGIAEGDVYLHNPRGSNNRLDENTRERANADRLFDSQNNNRGGYNVGSLYYYSGSVLSIEWTNQHSCNDPNSHCELILQYMCHDKLRDGIVTQTIPENRGQCLKGDCNSDTRFGMHENYDYYFNCKNRERNQGLFLADQKLNGNTAKHTRQNPGGTRRGYECPEERDYYPYWHPTEWKDIAIMTNNVSRCEYYVSQSQNVKSKFACVPPPGYSAALEQKNRLTRAIPINKTNCEALQWPPNDANATRGVWTEFKPHGINPPECLKAPWSRDNHNGNGIGGFPLMYNWTIPDLPHKHCALRLRYNVSTADYDGWTTDAIQAGEPELDIGSLVGLPAAEAKSRGYIFKNNPLVKPLKGFEDKFELQLAINTAQFGRVFQDRSHSFAIRQRPADLEGARVHNLNVRGKRGNIVQVYPAVEYDFVPNRLHAALNDYMHFQWTGSDTNPGNNDGQGRAGSDRSNVVLLEKQRYPEGTAGVAVPVDQKFGHWGNNYPEMVKFTTLLGFSETEIVYLALLQPGQFRGELSELDEAGTYYDLGPRKITSIGTYHYMCTRNNNFSNRSQKGKIVVSNAPASEKLIGWSGGTVRLAGSSQGVVIDKGTVHDSVQVRIETWSKAEGEAYIKSQGGRLNVGDGYLSDFFVLFPHSEFTVEGRSVAIDMKVDSAVGSSTLIYHSIDAKYWEKVPGIQIKDGVASFRTTKGGLFVGRYDEPVGMIAGVVIAFIVLVVLVVGVIVYCRKRPGRWNNFKQGVRNAHMGVKDRV